jgi:uncharacterized membrane protein
MWRYYFPLLTTTVAIVLAQFLQKTVPRHVHPLAALMVIYGVAFLVSLCGFLFISGPRELGAALGQVSWVSYALGFVILGLESGSLLAYRFGWKVSTYSMVVNASSALLLMPMGWWVFREKLTFTHGLGALLCLAGLILLADK